MDGFVLSYDSVGDVSDKGAAIMECFSPEKVPVISQLATEFGVFDHWYSSSMYNFLPLPPLLPSHQNNSTGSNNAE